MTHIFNQPEFYKLHETPRTFYFTLKDAQGHVEGVFQCGETEKGEFKSPFRGTFGSLSMQSYEADRVNAFLEQIETTLTEKGARRLTVAEPPVSHDTARAEKIAEIFGKRGYVTDFKDMDFAIEVDETPLFEKFEYNNRKRFNKCQRSGFKAAEVGDEASKAICELIRENRSAKGYPITMDHEAVMRMRKTFPTAVRFFAVYDGSKLAAAAICVRVTNTILYVYQWGHAADYSAYSPVAFLASEIYEFCRREKIRLLDLGISTDHGQSNPGLIKFKEGLGAKSALKITYSKMLLQKAA